MQESGIKLSFSDRLCVLANNMLTTLLVKPRAGRSNPAANQVDGELTRQQRRHSAGLMRVNHVGEICAQALYQGQALTARSAPIKQAMQQSAAEEEDHLAWCAERLQELASHPSYLNPGWYLGALMLGIMAGIAGDRWSLGFVVETEQQVVKHLAAHLTKLPENDQRSRAIVAQMQVDEAQHAHAALTLGALALPRPLQQLMAVMAKLMTKTAYYV